MNFLGQMFGVGQQGQGINHVPSKPMTYIRAFKAYSEVFMSSKTSSEHLRRGNKIIMPNEALIEIARGKMDGEPLTFMVSNPKFGIKTHVGVLEFSADDGVCYLPTWMMEYLCLEEGSEIFVRSKELKKGTFIALQPHQTAFVTELSNPKAILEAELTHYACLTQGDKININYQGRDYTISVAECKPEKEICIVNTDVELEFKEPLDYEDYQPPKLAKQNSKVDFGNQEMQQELTKEIEEKYKRLDGKTLSKKQKEKLMQQKMAEEKRLTEDFDPRKHRLPDGFPTGVSSFQGSGVKLG